MISWYEDVDFHHFALVSAPLLPAQSAPRSRVVGPIARSLRCLRLLVRENIDAFIGSSLSCQTCFRKFDERIESKVIDKDQWTHLPTICFGSPEIKKHTADRSLSFRLSNPFDISLHTPLLHPPCCMILCARYFW